MTLTDHPSYQFLLSQNKDLLARLAERHDLTVVRDIEIASRYTDWDTAMEARKYVDEKYDIPRGILFRVNSLNYSDEDITIDLRFSLEEIPTAEAITRYELMLIDAAEKFGGETPGWEIEIKPPKAPRKPQQTKPLAAPLKAQIPLSEIMETEAYRTLLAQNKDLLAHLGSQHDLTVAREIEISSRYQDREKAREARKYVDQKYAIPQRILFSVVSMKYSEDDITIDLRFDLREKPSAEAITRYELMLIDAAEKFGGETPGWEIEIKPPKAPRKPRQRKPLAPEA